MARIDIRCAARIPVSVTPLNGQKAEHQSVTANVGLGGAFINSSFSLPKDTVVRIRAPFPNLGELEIKGRVLRNESDGAAVKFMNMEPQVTSALWDYIRENLRDNECPYCGNGIRPQAEKCASCGMSVNFRDDAYLDLHKKETEKRWLDFIDREGKNFIQKMESIGTSNTGSNYEIFKKTMDDFTDSAEKFELGAADLEIIRSARKNFHLKTDHIFKQSYFTNRARVWPQGYQGDYKIIEGIYRNLPLSTGIGYFLDRYFLSAELAVAVRGRLEKLKEILKKDLDERERPQVLDIGSGPCRELFELAPEIKKSGATVTCLDIDSDALDFGLNRLSYTDIAPQVSFRKYNVVRMLNAEKNMREFGPHDIIYSTGVFNYLADGISIGLMKSLYGLLKPAGKLIIAFENSEHYRTQGYHWFVDWDGLMNRMESESRRLFEEAQIPDNFLNPFYDRSGIINFFIISKES